MTYVTSDLKKRNKNRAGCPDIKKVEQVGRDSFIAGTHGKDTFEGKFNPNTHRITNDGRVVTR